MEEYVSNGKLLLTGEYLVLQGAQAIALPVRLGQTLQISPADDNKIHWETVYQDELIFTGTFTKEYFKTVETNNPAISAFISNLLVNAFLLKKQENKGGWNIKTILDFPLSWGLGSSSTLINNISKWLDINPFKLNRIITRGSGYDIACAESRNPIIYERKNDQPFFSEFKWNPPFKNHIYFVYTGRKQHSAAEVNAFMKNNIQNKNISEEIEAINNRITRTEKLSEFEKALSEHEEKLSGILQKKKARDQHFQEFPGVVKSLGAWGGDFLLLTWKETENELKRYLERHNMSIFFTWDQLIKTETR